MSSVSEISLILLVGVVVLICNASVLDVVDSPFITNTSRTFENGSVVMLSPVGSLRATGEKILCGTPVTHVGLVWVDATDTPFLFHTTRKDGACLTPLKPWIERTTRHSQVFVRRIGGVPAPSGHALETAIRPFLGVRYSFGFWQAVMQTWWPGMELPRATAPSDRFCSELVAEVLEAVDVLTFTATPLAPRLVLPGDFWATSRLRFARGATLLAPEEVTLNRD